MIKDIMDVPFPLAASRRLMSFLTFHICRRVNDRSERNEISRSQAHLNILFSVGGLRGRHGEVFDR